MTPHEIFLHMSPALAGQLLSELREKEIRLYKATIETLAKQRKLRPIFVERKPRDERHAWMRENIARRQNDSVAAHLLQIWFVSQHRDLLCDFLDGLGIAHDENGTVDNLPPPPERTKLEEVIATLLPKYGEEVVAVYLHAFQALDETGWPVLNEVIDADKRLALPRA